jgi:hypothetical protein
MKKATPGKAGLAMAASSPPTKAEPAAATNNGGLFIFSRKTIGQVHAYHDRTPGV